MNELPPASRCLLEMQFAFAAHANSDLLRPALLCIAFVFVWNLVAIFLVPLPKRAEPELDDAGESSKTR